MSEQIIASKSDKHNSDQLKNKQVAGISAKREAAHQKNTRVQGGKLKAEIYLAERAKYNHRVE